MYQQSNVTLNQVSACNAKLDWLMCVAYNNYLHKQMEKEKMKKNVESSIVGKIVTQNVFKTMNNCNFVTLIVNSNLASDMITKVLESI